VDVVPLLVSLTGVVFLARMHVVLPLDLANQFYGVTDRRVLIIHRWLRSRVEAFPLHGMAATNVVVEDTVTGGLGTIGFADFAQRCGYDNDEICMPEFTAIPDAAGVAELIRSAIRATPAAWKSGSGASPPETGN
jgi:hypothetical protein